MRKCSKCLQELPLENFSRNASRKDGLNERCRECCNKYIRQHYQKNKKYYIDKARDRRDRLKEFLYTIKCSCEKCGESHPSCLDFHHKDSSQKEFSIGTFYKKVTNKKLLEEIAKCIVLCSNCHRKLHWEEKYGTS